MEFIEYEYNFDSFVEFLEEHDGVLFQEDYTQFVLLAIEHKNIKVINHIIENNLLDDWEDHLALLYSYEMKEYLEKLIKKNIDINSKNEGNTILDYTVLDYITTTNNQDEKLSYILYIIENNGNLDIDLFCKQIKEGLIDDNNAQKVMYVIDILILYNIINKTLELDTEELQLLFENMDKNNKELLENIDEYLINILKKYYNVDNKDDLFLCINKLRIINKSAWVDVDLFIYHDGTQNWCFSKEDVKYIRNTKMNPLNDTRIPNYIINLM